ncbi:MAG: DNA ligase [Colwellia sp.]|nr:DNA ligase [Colwellia sp.]
MKRTTPYSYSFYLLPLLLLLCDISQATAVKPLIQLAKTYSIKNPNHTLKVQQYWVSEKLDGVRGRWTGSSLITRQGHIINLPKNFTKNWPKVALDGEVWLGRNQFEQISGIVRRKTVNSDDWKNIRFMIFDLPNHQGNFSQRLITMNSLVTKAQSPNLQVIAQIKLSNLQELSAYLDKIVQLKGEGLMLHHQEAFYTTGRSNQLLKLKKYSDSEATVIAHLEGRGENKGKMGAILVTTTKGVTFKIGTGFSDKQRMTPPPIGCIITFKHFGNTQNGVPRFASFMRIRHLGEQSSRAKETK